MKGMKGYKMTETQENLELKAQALLQRIGELTANYENNIADLRVALTNQTNLANRLQQRWMEAQEQSSYDEPNVVGSEVVEEE